MVSIDSVSPTVATASGPTWPTQKMSTTANTDSISISSTIGTASRMMARPIGPEAQSWWRAATQLATRPQPRLHRRLRGGSFKPVHDDRGAPALVDRNEMQNRNGPLGRGVLESQLRAARLAARLERDRRARAFVVPVHPCLQYVHRVLLKTRFRHAPSFISGAPKSRGSCPRARLRAAAPVVGPRYPD